MHAARAAQIGVTGTAMDYVFLAFGGFLIGVVVAAPIGPVNLICIRRALAHGPLRGFFSGLGAALGDGVFAAVTMFGLTAVDQWIRGYAELLTLVSGLILIGFGVYIFRSWTVFSADANVGVTDTSATNLAGTMASTFVLCMTNPATFIGVAALLTGLGGLIEAEAAVLGATITVMGVVVGSTGWWFAITTITGVFHRRINPAVMRQINHWMGIAVMTFGAIMLGDFFFQFY